MYYKYMQILIIVYVIVQNLIQVRTSTYKYIQVCHIYTVQASTKYVHCIISLCITSSGGTLRVSPWELPTWSISFSRLCIGRWTMDAWAQGPRSVVQLWGWKTRKSAPPKLYPPWWIGWIWTEQLYESHSFHIGINHESLLVSVRQSRGFILCWTCFTTVSLPSCCLGASSKVISEGGQTRRAVGRAC